MGSVCFHERQARTGTGTHRQAAAGRCWQAQAGTGTGTHKHTQAGSSRQADRHR